MLTDTASSAQLAFTALPVLTRSYLQARYRTLILWALTCILWAFVSVCVRSDRSPPSAASPSATSALLLLFLVLFVLIGVLLKGPRWCSAEVKHECSYENKTACVPNVTQCQPTGPTDGSCADQCCKNHDTCCGSSNRTVCNAGIISCLKACPSGPGSKGKTCMNGILPVPVDVLLAGMEVDPFGCCGAPCSYVGPDQ